MIPLKDEIVMNKNSFNVKYNQDLVAYKEKAFKSDLIMPKRFCLVLTNLCNLACDFCYQFRTKQKNAMNAEGWIKLIRDIPENSRITLTGGEPLAYKGFEEIFIKSNTNHYTNIITNGTLLNNNLFPK